jgi:hypothetical protein
MTLEARWYGYHADEESVFLDKLLVEMVYRVQIKPVEARNGSSQRRRKNNVIILTLNVQHSMTNGVGLPRVCAFCYEWLTISITVVSVPANAR